MRPHIQLCRPYFAMAFKDNYCNIVHLWQANAYIFIMTVMSLLLEIFRPFFQKDIEAVDASNVILMPGAFMAAGLGKKHVDVTRLQRQKG